MASIYFRKVTVEVLGQLTQVVQERMGHYYLVFTLRVYSHVLPGMQSQAAYDWRLASSATASESSEGSGETDRGRGRSRLRPLMGLRSL